MKDETDRGPDPLPEVHVVSFTDIRAVLALGWRDFRRAPLFGLFFSLVYVGGGLILWQIYGVAGMEWWLAPLAVGFPLLAPFAAVGLYEVSRRLACRQPLHWGKVLSVVLGQKDRQIPAMAAVIIVVFLFWVFVAHALVALFLGLRAYSTDSGIVTLFFEGNGLVLLLVGSVVGAGFAGALFAVTVVGLPLLLDREVDFVTAMIHSVQAVTGNLPVMIVWGAIISAILMVAMVPMFLGLFIALPVLGHASWHMYARLSGLEPGIAEMETP